MSTVAEQANRPATTVIPLKDTCPHGHPEEALSGEDDGDVVISSPVSTFAHQPPTTTVIDEDVPRLQGRELRFRYGHKPSS